MNKKLKRALASTVVLAMAASAVPLSASADDENTIVPIVDGDTVLNEWKFDFGAAENAAEGYTAVSADTQYSNSLGYGFLGLENGFAQDSRDDGWTMTQGYDLVLENGAKETVSTADDDWVATTTRIEKEQDYTSPIRFAMKSEENTYYRVRIHLNRNDAAEEAKVSLFTEKRHQQLLDEPIPAEGLVYECSVYVHNNWSKNTYEYVDTMLNIVATGENVAISSIEVQEVEQAKTFWILGDSTVCQQTAAIPYFPLDHCQGVGSAMAKYLGSDWAIVNEAESGLSASASTNHFNNFINDVKPGDIVWFEFGHNDDKVSNDPSTNGYLSSLENYYNQITAKGASMVIASPIERDQSSQFIDGEWNYTLSHYTTAASNFVDQQIAAGKNNIAFINLNTASLEFLNEVQAEIDSARAEAGLESLGAATTRFYYYVSKYTGYVNDYTHPNDYGADNFAYRAVLEAKETISAAESADASDSVKAQAAVLNTIFGSTRDTQAVELASEIYLNGAAPNDYYPSELAKVVLYENPLIIKSVSFDETTMVPTEMSVNLVASEKEYSYGRGVIEIYDSEDSLKGRVTTSDVVDAVAGDTQNITFSSTDVTFDQTAGDTFKAYVIKIEQNLEDGGYTDTDEVISTIYTQDDMVDIKNYLLQGALGTENREDFSSYGLSEGESIIGENGWTNPGGESFVFGQEGDVTYAHCETTGASTYYPSTKFLDGASVSSGQLYCRFDIRYIAGTFNLYFTDGTALNNWPEGRIMPIQITQNSNSEVAVYLNGVEKCQINSGEWTTIALIVDLDYGTYTLKVNGQTYTENVDSLQGSMTPVPSSIALMAFQNDRTTNEYDITNIVLAELNAPELPDRTITVSSANETQGTVAIQQNGETVSNPFTAVMNTNVAAVASANDGWVFSHWSDPDGNIVSYSPIYELRLYEDVDITAVFSQEEYDPISEYVYKEDFSTWTTSTLDWTQNGKNTIETDTTEGIGQYFQSVPNSSSGNRSAYKALPTESQLGGNLILEFDMQMTNSSSRPNQIAILGSGVNESRNGFFTDSYILSFTQQAGTKEFAVNATEITDSAVSGYQAMSSGYPGGVWAHIYAEVDFESKDIDLTITSLDGNTVYVDQTVQMADNVTAFGAIQVTCGRNEAVIALDNIKIYDPDAVHPSAEPSEQPSDEPSEQPSAEPSEQPSAEPSEQPSAEPSEEPVITVDDAPSLTDDGNVSISITNETETDQPVRLIVVSYENGVLKSIKLSDTESIAAGASADITAGAPDTTEFKILLWDSLGAGSPLMDFVTELAEDSNSISFQAETEHFMIYSEDDDAETAVQAAEYMESNYDRITTDLKVEPSEKCDFTVYPDLASFHTAIGYEDAPDWLVGMADGNYSLRIVSPNNPGPAHSYEDIMSVAVHEFAHIVINELNDDVPTYLNEGTAAYEAGQSSGVAELVQTTIDNGTFPTIGQLKTLDGNNGLYQFGYALVDYVVESYGYDKLIEFIETPDIQSVFDMSEDEFSAQWKQFYN